MSEVLVRREQHYSSDVIDLCSEDILNCEDTADRFNTDPGSACAGCHGVGVTTTDSSGSTGSSLICFYSTKVDTSLVQLASESINV